MIAVLSVGAITFANDNPIEELKTPETVQVENNENQPTVEESTEAGATQTNQEEYKTLKNDRTGDTITTSEKVQPEGTIAQPSSSQTETSEDTQSEPDPRTITKVSTVDGTPTDKNPNPLRTCNYTLQTGETAVVKQSNTTPCYGVGEILPRY